MTISPKKVSQFIAPICSKCIIILHLSRGFITWCYQAPINFKESFIRFP